MNKRVLILPLIAFLLSACSTQIEGPAIGASQSPTKSAPDFLKVGETGEDAGISFKFDSFSCTDQVVGPKDMHVVWGFSETGAKCVATFLITNNTEQIWSVYSDTAVVADGDNLQWRAEDVELFGYTWIEVSPGLAQYANFVFAVEPDRLPAQIRVKATSSSPGLRFDVDRQTKWSDEFYCGDIAPGGYEVDAPCRLWPGIG